MAKYGNRVFEVDGVLWHSQAEFARWRELQLLEQAGQVSDLRRQVRYELVPGFRDNTGKRQRAVTWTADFVYKEGGRTVAEDVKGVQVRDFSIRAKLFMQRYPDILLRITRA